MIDARRAFPRIATTAPCVALVALRGTAKSVEVGRSSKGRWKISGNELCASVPIGANYYCRTAIRSGKSFILLAGGQDLYEVTVEARSAKFHFD